MKQFRIKQITNFVLPLARGASTAPQPNPVSDYLKKAENVASKYSQHVDEAVDRWAKCDEIYYGKERDMINFPTVKYPLTHPKVRLGFLPDSWFQALYPKTGVTGPYLFLFGSTMFLLSKEIWVVDPHFVELGVFVTVMTWLIKRFGPMVSKRLDADVEVSRSTAVNDLIKAKEENVDLQLEAAYRERLQQVHRAVHRRLVSCTQSCPIAKHSRLHIAIRSC
ncbi:unnamed protein product [Echinostoma caproni]|uniref:ATP synthase subunit b n=1 Tax=Echinostoma caproni TaxID=27848 RepID=A0A3P8GYY2_9TREM|nr:unnamed protein product [Echinostoma caproni]